MAEGRHPRLVGHARRRSSSLADCPQAPPPATFAEAFPICQHRRREQPDTKPVTRRLVPTTAGATIESPWFTAAEAAAYLRIVSADGSLHAFYIAYPRMGIPAYRFTGSRGIRFHQDDLDNALRRARITPTADQEDH